MHTAQGIRAKVRQFTESQRGPSYPTRVDYDDFFLPGKTSSTQRAAEGLLDAGTRLSQTQAAYVRLSNAVTASTCLATILIGQLTFGLGTYLHGQGIGHFLRLFGIGATLAGLIMLSRIPWGLLRCRRDRMRMRGRSLAFGIVAIGGPGALPADLLWRSYLESALPPDPPAPDADEDRRKRYQEQQLVTRHVRDWVADRLGDARTQDTFASLSGEYHGTAEELAEVARRV